MAILDLKLHGASMLAAAQGRLSSITWRVQLGLVFAVSVSLAVNSVLVAMVWYGALCAAMGADYLLAKRYLAAETQARRKFYGALFTFGCAVSICVFASMTIIVAMQGGAPGRVLSVLMAASSLVSVMLFLFQAPVFLMITAAPCAICLAIAPFIPFRPSPSGQLEGAIAIGLGVAAFLAYVARAAIHNGKMFQGLQAANDIAKERAEEAEAKRAEAEEANRAKSAFLATMTHELRTPLNAVIGFSEIIQEDLAGEGRAALAGDAARITHSGRHLLSLIDQILQVSTMDSGRSRLKLSDFDVADLIQNAAARHEGEANAANNRIVLTIAPSLPLAHTDREKLDICIGHLLSNAVRFTTDGTIWVSAEHEIVTACDWLCIAVRDTGIGMRPQELAKAFQPFAQADDSATRTRGGMGLGLTLTLGAAQLLGGGVSAVSEPGVGSTFTLRVPMTLDRRQERRLENLEAGLMGRAAA